jgi:predicted naringenin-chalcone synthase
MIWMAGDCGLRLELSQQLSETLADQLPSAVAAFLEENGTSVDSIDHWLVHPGGPQILDGVQRSLGLAENALDHSRAVLRRYGNMSSPTILFIMKEHFESKVDGSVMALAFGPGLTIEMALLEVDHTRL